MRNVPLGPTWDSAVRKVPVGPNAGGVTRVGSSDLSVADSSGPAGPTSDKSADATAASPDPMTKAFG